MGHNLKHSKKMENDEEEEENPPTDSPEIEKPRKSSESLQEEEIKFGEQLQDDVINFFCDKLQAVCPRKIEALLAIQFLMISDVGEFKKHVTGKQMALQVLYDTARKHYVLLHYDPKFQHIIIYDSLQQYENNGNPKIITEISKQIGHLFGHLHHKYIHLLVDKEYEQQEDNFSCGYRCIGALVDLARNRNPASYTYSRTEILEFLKRIQNEPNPTWKMFENARFGREKEYSGDQRIRCHMKNPQYVPRTRTSSSSTATPTTSRTPSTWSSMGSLDGKRASAGLTITLDSSPEPPKYTLYPPKSDAKPEKLDTTIELSSSSPRPLTPPLVPPNDPNLSPYVCFKDALLSIYHTPTGWKAWFSRTKKADK